MRVLLGEVNCQLMTTFEDEPVPWHVLIPENSSTEQAIKEKFSFQQARRVPDRRDPTKPARVEFLTGGITRRAGWVPVEDITVDEDSIYVRVQETTAVAREIRKEFMELLTNCKPPWQFFESRIRKEAHATRTTAEVDFELFKLFSREFSKFLQEKLEKAFRKEKTRVVTHPILLGFKINVLPLSPDPSNLALNFGRYDFVIRLEKFEDYVKRRYNIFSELEYERHMQLLEELEKMLAKGSTKTKKRR